MTTRLFGNIGQKEKILLGNEFTGYVTGVTELPDPSTATLGECHLLLNYQPVPEGFNLTRPITYLPGVIYCLREIDGIKQWIDITVTEFGALAAPAASTFWKRLTKDSIILRWIDPDDVVDETNHWNDATWDHDVVVRKYGSEPSSVADGEIVGYSTVRNQYNDASEGFVHNVDAVEDKHYYYRVFHVTIGGVATPSRNSLQTTWTWTDIKETIDNDRHRKVFQLGDVFDLPYHEDFGQLTATLVAWDHEKLINVKDNKEVTKPCMTFMLNEALTRKYGNRIQGLTFDNKELEYVVTNDKNIKSSKKYFLVKSSTGEFIDVDADGNPIQWNPRADGFYINQELARVTPILTETLQAANKLASNEYVQFAELHRSIRYFLAALEGSVSSVEELDALKDQLCTKDGLSYWSASCLRRWLTLDWGLAGQDNESAESIAERNDIYYGPYRKRENRYSSYRDGLLYRSDLGWMLETTDVGSDDINLKKAWLGQRNGWYQTYAANDAASIAPASRDSGYYVDIPPFACGFKDQSLMKAIDPENVKVRKVTILDQYIEGPTRGNPTDDLEITGYSNSNTEGARGAIRSEEVFWIPSFEEIYGRRPTIGINGKITDEFTKGTSEGKQFDLFKEAMTDNTKFRNLCIKTCSSDPSLQCGWYLRSCDPTTVSRVFYVPQDPPRVTDIAGQEVTCGAHRYVDEATRIGPVLCFTVSKS